MRRKESQLGLIEFYGKWKISLRLHQKKANSLKKRIQFLFLWLTISVTWPMASVITNLSQELSSSRCAVPVNVVKKVCFTQCCLTAADFLHHYLCFSLIIVKAANCFQVISSHLESHSAIVAEDSLKRIAERMTGLTEFKLLCFLCRWSLLSQIPWSHWTLRVSGVQSTMFSSATPPHVNSTTVLGTGLGSSR